MIGPYGGELVDLVAAGEGREELLRRAAALPRVRLSERALCDLELMATGGLSPLRTFMGRGDYERVLGEMRLLDGTLFPLPVTLSVGAGAPVRLDAELALTDGFNNLLAVLRVEEVFERDRGEARLVCGTEDARHPLVAEMESWGELNVSGRLRVIRLPPRYDFKALRMTPAEVRARLAALGRAHVVAFQTRNPLHRAHEEMTKAAVREVGGALLLHPAVGMTRPGDVDHYTRVRSYKLLAERYYERSNTLLAILPLAMRMAGPREALWHAVIRRNYGADHLIVGRDHASPGKDSAGRPFYEPYAAQELVARHAAETGVRAVAFSEFVYLPEEGRYVESAHAPAGARTLSLSGTAVREEYLRRGRRLPLWFTRPEVAELLERANPPRERRGFCVWFTGLSGAGKSTTANVLAARLLEHGRAVTVLDGDVVREHLSKGLGFSKEDRDANVRRIGFVASEIARHGGAVICAAISPYRETREWCRRLFGEGCFVEAFVDAPLSVCEARDPKGMYRQARAGEIKNFTGVDDPYEKPWRAELVLDSVAHPAEDNAAAVLSLLMARGFVSPDSDREPIAEFGLRITD